ncbi:MAG: carboxypeptidase-like regulatory domain-containing protein, partial [Acidobacteriota bacterium]
MTLLYEDEPLVGARVFIREHRGNYRQSFRSREEGKVYAFLSKDKLWNFEVTHDDLGIATSFLKVEIPEIEAGDPHAKKELIIANTRLFGEVVDTLGNPVLETLHFNFSSEEFGNIQRFVESGRFDFKGLPEGALHLQATLDQADGGTLMQSERLMVQLEQGVDQGPLVVQMLRTATLSGLVVAPSGDGVPGAQVVALLESSSPGSLTTAVPKAVTDFEGVFELDLPASAEVAQLTVYPPGFTALQQRVPLPQDPNAPLIIPVDDLGGTVTLRYESPPSEWLEAPSQLSLNTILYSPVKTPPDERDTCYELATPDESVAFVSIGATQFNGRDDWPFA